MTTTAKGRGKPRKWRGVLMEDGSVEAHCNQPYDAADCTVYPDGCDPTPAAAKRLIQMALDWGDMKAGNAMLLDAIGTYRKHLTKSTGAKRGKKK